ncbi:MAG: YcaO-like family protein [Gammaproteobacteria bacterium]
MLNISITPTSYPLSQTTNKLLKRMLSPLCGLIQEIGFIRRGKFEPKIIATGADLTGVHVLLNKQNPGRSAYHIGANGVHFNEAIIKTLAESLERYSQLVSEVSNRFSTQLLSYRERIQREGENVLPNKYLHLFSDAQYERQDFPFEKYCDQPLAWIKLQSLLGVHTVYVPAQFVLVGYQVKKKLREPWLCAAVTTGTAAHTDKVKALNNAILELIQIDSAMGHWYSSQQAPKIDFDSRTNALKTLLQKQQHFDPQCFSFHWLKNPDLVGFSIACVYRKSANGIPKVAIGLGSDGRLVRAMYKAYLEALGVIGLARMVVFNKENTVTTFCEDENSYYDLDSNVGHYATGQRFSFIQEKFPLDKIINASDLPRDIDENEVNLLKELVASFKHSNKELLFCDLTCHEADDLGFCVPRVWSQDVLSLCLPSAPWVQHPRFLAYGGLAHELPHPYP